MFIEEAKSKIGALTFPSLVAYLRGQRATPPQR